LRIEKTAESHDYNIVIIYKRKDRVGVYDLHAGGTERCSRKYHDEDANAPENEQTLCQSEKSSEQPVDSMYKRYLFDDLQQENDYAERDEQDQEQEYESNGVNDDPGYPF